MIRSAILWLTLYAISVGLGYPTLNRYDPRQTGGLSDTAIYYQLTEHGPDGVDSQLKYRLLIPLLARPVANRVTGHADTWNSVFTGLLVVNSLFTATTAWLLIRAARHLAVPEAIALLAAALYLLNFETANIQLSGMVDSGEGCFLMAIAWALLGGSLWLLPLWGLLGAACKETFVPLCIAFTATWWLCAGRHRKAIMLSPAVAALGGITILQSVVSGHLVWPWDFAAALHPAGAHFRALGENIFDKNLLYCVVWLVPLAIPRLMRLPHRWVLAAGSAVAMDFALVFWHGSTAGAAARPFFNAAGPLLSLSAARYLSREAVSA